MSRHGAASGVCWQSRCVENARPQQPHGAEFRQRQEHVLVGGERHADGALQTIVVELFEGAQIGDAGCERESEFLRLARPRIMPDRARGLREGTAEMLRRAMRRLISAAASARSLIGARCRSDRGRSSSRKPFRIDRLCRDPLRQARRPLRRLAAPASRRSVDRIDPDIGHETRDAFRVIGREAEAMRCRRIGENQRQGRWRRD